jgi:membrane protease YdiL (CAAX protease family)
MSDPGSEPDLERLVERRPSDFDPIGNRAGRFQLTLLLGGLLLAGLVIGGAAYLGGEGGHFAQAGFLLAPPGLLAALLQLGLRYQWARGLAWLWYWLLMVALGVVAFGLALGALGGDEAPSTSALKLGALFGLLLLGWLLGAGLTATGAWWSLGQRLGGRLARGSAAHAQGLSGLVQFVAISLAPLLVLGGQPPLLLLVARDPSSLGLDRSASGQLLDMFYSLAWTLPFALLAAGLPLKRGLRAALTRLGLQSLARRDLLVMVGLALGLVVLLLPVDWLTSLVWERAGWPRTDASALEQLFEAHGSPAGALSVGITAGLGEELVVRGLLQPRLGWFLPNLAFTAAHAYQYGVDGLISVFLTGATLAWVRHRWNTTASALTHGLYDFILVVGGLLQLPGF